MPDARSSILISTELCLLSSIFGYKKLYHVPAAQTDRKLTRRFFNQSGRSTKSIVTWFRHVFPRLPPVASFSRIWRRLLVFPRLVLIGFFPRLAPVPDFLLRVLTSSLGTLHFCSSYQFQFQLSVSNCLPPPFPGKSRVWLVIRLSPELCH